MTRYAAFLRGVNVGGVNRKMAAVVQALQAAGFANVRTMFASGNVLLESRSGTTAVRKNAEQALRSEFGYDAWVLVYEMGELAEISAAYPFGREVEGRHSYITFVSDAGVLGELSGFAEQPGDGENIRAGSRVIYWQVPRTSTLDSTIGKTMGKKRFKSSTTTRNLRTIDEVLQKGLAPRTSKSTSRLRKTGTK
ncbi:MAG: DUF1697 domain-containing protein [Actinomycetia bacterium]|nr:DUF1697 domain-containing protein [Actinomycetes bacterium]